MDLAAPAAMVQLLPQLIQLQGSYFSASRYAIWYTPNNRYGESRNFDGSAHRCCGSHQHINPDLTASEVKAILVDNAKNNPFIEAKVEDRAMLDFQQALNAFDSLTSFNSLF